MKRKKYKSPTDWMVKVAEIATAVCFMVLIGAGAIIGISIYRYFAS